jgi:hypothetical protein
MPRSVIEATSIVILDVLVSRWKRCNVIGLKLEVGFCHGHISRLHGFGRDVVVLGAWVIPQGIETWSALRCIDSLEGLQSGGLPSLVRADENRLSLIDLE